MHAELAVIGGGPAGLSAARAAARRGVAVVLVDAGDAAGGALALQAHEYADFRQRGYDYGQFLRDLAVSAGAMLLPRTVAWGFFEDGSIGIVRGHDTPDARAEMLHAEYVIIATGATDRTATFPGATLPGVYTTTAVLTMLHRWRVRPGDAALIVGADPYTSHVIQMLHDAGMRVEMTPSDVGLRANAGADGALASVTRANGTVIAADTLVLSLGGDPAAELARMRGCAIVDVTGRTNVSTVYIAGDAARVSSVNAAMRHGTIAGDAVADALGKPMPHALSKPGSEAGRTPPISIELRDGAIFVCRCEDVTYAEAGAAIEAGATTLEIRADDMTLLLRIG